MSKSLNTSAVRSSVQYTNTFEMMHRSRHSNPDAVTASTSALISH